MKTEAAFWDSSAIVPVCCVQECSVSARRAYRKFKKPIVWWGTPVEMQSALRKLNQTGSLTKRQSISALRLWEKFRASSHSVILYEKTIVLAEEMPEKFGLRSLDAFQLASALIWCNERPRNRPFICADLRLGEAAKDAGFDLVSLG